jgi:hypothetical protein
MKYILSALAAVTLLVGIGASQPAEARCFWNGFGRSASTMVLGGGTVTTPSFIGHIGGAATKPSQLA